MRPTPEGTAAAQEQTARVFAQMREVNEQLVISAVRAQVEVETAERNLQTVARAAELDALTSLPNRALFLDRFVHASAIARRHGNRLAVVFVDLNNFKQINDSLGHTVGDEVLRRAAHALSRAVRGSDTVSRQGGDEFVLLLTDIAVAADAAYIAEKVSAAVAVPSLFGDHVVRVTASLGISIYPDNGSDAAVLIDLADAAMYRAKRRGLGTCAFHGDEFPGELQLAQTTLAALQHPVTTVDSAQAEGLRREVALREANEHLVLAVLNAQSKQADSEHAQRRQREFIATLAHELRNPLAPMLNVSALIERVQPDDAMLPRLRSIIERQVAHMTRLIDDLMDITRAETGKLRLALAPIEVAAVIAESIEACRPAMDLRLQTFTTSVTASSVPVLGDRVRLTQVFTNLLDNASKYTPDSGIISLVLSTDGENAVVTIADGGIGISGDAVPRIFELFAQDHHAVGFNGVGLGIGLSVVHSLVIAHGGSVQAFSAGPGMGSQFVVTLPLHVPATVPDAPAAPLPE